MDKPDDLTSVTRAILSDEEAKEIYEDSYARDPPFGTKHGLRRVLNAFAQRAGVTGEKVEVEISNGPAAVKGDTFYVCKEGAGARPPILHATLYIRPPAPAKKSAEERVEEALKVYDAARNEQWPLDKMSRIARILRGEE
jgi:hypothetical protein